MVAVVCANEKTFETIHGMLNHVMEKLNVPVRLPDQGALACAHCLCHPKCNSLLIATHVSSERECADCAIAGSGSARRELAPD